MKRTAGPGRPKGSKSKVTKARLEFVSELFDSPEYRDSLQRRVLGGRALPMETMLWQYLEGKPTEKIEHSVAAHSGPLFQIIIPPDRHERDDA